MNNTIKHMRAGPTATLSAVAVAVALALAPAQSMAKATEATAEAAVERNFTDDQWEDMVGSSLALRVQSALAKSSSLRGSNIKVTADHEGNVELEGKVATERQEERAVRIARSVRGVNDVDEDLDVDSSLGDARFEAIDDNDLAKNAAEAIASAIPGSRVEADWFFGYDVKGNGKDGDAWEIDVEADDGEVELDGELPTNADVQKALETVRALPGVRSVENDLYSDEMRHLAYAPNAYRPFIHNRPYPGTLVSATGTVEGELVCQLRSPTEKVAKANTQ